MKVLEHSDLVLEHSDLALEHSDFIENKHRQQTAVIIIWLTWSWTNENEMKVSYKIQLTNIYSPLGSSTDFLFDYE